MELPDWNEPDVETLKELTRFGCFAADMALIKEPHENTMAARTRVAVEASLRALLANGLIQASVPTDEIVFRPTKPPSED